MITRNRRLQLLTVPLKLHITGTVIHKKSVKMMGVKLFTTVMVIICLFLVVEGMPRTKKMHRKVTYQPKNHAIVAQRSQDASGPMSPSYKTLREALRKALGEKKNLVEQDSDCPTARCVDSVPDENTLCDVCPNGQNCWLIPGDTTMADGNIMVHSMGSDCSATCVCPTTRTYEERGRDTRAACSLQCTGAHYTPEEVEQWWPNGLPFSKRELP